MSPDKKSKRQERREKLKQQQPDLRSRDRLWIQAVPEIRQDLQGVDWMRSEAGLVQVPRSGGFAFGAAAFAVALETGEFLLIAPSELGGVDGLIGGTFLTTSDGGTSLESYVFVMPNRQG